MASSEFNMLLGQFRWDLQMINVILPSYCTAIVVMGNADLEIGTAFGRGCANCG
jgi:hypothetical protein